MTVEAHTQKVTHSYRIRFPDHEPRESDPHYTDFREYRRRTHATAQCAFGVARGGDFSECGGGLELHHAILEYALANEVDLELLERDYPGISNRDKVGAWIESADNLTYYCVRHHRAAEGVHLLSASDWAAAKYIRNLIVEED